MPENRFWDAVSVERTLISEGEKKGRAEERENLRNSDITRMRSMGLSDNQISMFLDLPLEYGQQH